MGFRHRVAALLLFLFASGASAGCKDKHVAEVAPAEAKPPADRLAPGELPLGSDRAFGLKLPRASKVVQRFGGSVFVLSENSPEELANFVRIHVKGGNVVAGTGSTRFVDVVVPEETARHLTIEVQPARLGTGMRSSMSVEDVTPQPVDPNATTEDKWRKAGLTPDGHLLDPKNMQ
jgi:hypothetical protein